MLYVSQQHQCLGAIVMKWGGKLRLFKNDVFFLRQFASSRAPAIDSFDRSLSWMGLVVAQEMQI